jgi:hypothetical protein
VRLRSKRPIHIVRATPLSMKQKVAFQTLEQRMATRAQKDHVKVLENDLKDARKKRIEEAKAKRLEKEKRRIANEYKNSSYQMIDATKMKTMSKKQLRMVKKTSVNSKGQVELVNPWGDGTGASNKKLATKKNKKK